jgi:hypothetical protein
MYDRKKFKRDNLKRFFDYQHKFLTFYKSVEDSLSLELNITDCSTNFKDLIKTHIDCDAILCFKISQHLDGSRELLYVYFVAKQVAWNKEFCGFYWITLEGKSVKKPASLTALELTDINNKILEYFGGK